MTVQSVGSITANLKAVSNQAGTTTAATDSFSSVMNATAKSNTTGTKQTASTQKTETKNRISDRNSSSAEKTQSVDKKVTADSDAKNTITDPKNELPKEEFIQDNSTKVEELEEVLAEIATLLNTITDMISQVLNVSEDELTQAGLELNLEPLDLLQGNGLKDLFLKVNDAQPEELLTNETLLENFNKLQTAVNELLTEAGVTNGELFEAVQAEGTDILSDSAFAEVVNEYLTAVEPEETEKLPEVEVVDLRNKTEITKTEETSTENRTENENAEVNEFKTVAKTEEKENTDSKSDSKSEGRPEEFVKANDFLKNLAGAKENVEDAIQEARPNSFRELYDITGQTIRQMKVTLTADTSSMEIQLNPQHLGKVDVQITSKNGALSAEITAHTEAAKRALESGLEELKVTLQDTGLKVENVEVTLADYGFRQRDDSERGDNHSNNRHGRRRNSEELNTDTTLRSDFEAVSEIMKELNGNNVDYIA